MKIKATFILVVIKTVSFALACCAFLFAGLKLSWWASLQAGPACVKFLTSFAWSSTFIVAALLISAFLFGRFYCSFMCPLGILQDAINFVSPKKKKRYEYNVKKTRYTVTLISFVALGAGWATGFYLLDPYSVFGRISSVLFNPAFIFIHNTIVPLQPLVLSISNVNSLLLGGAVAPLVILIALTVFLKRIFCVSLCPVGTLLGVCSRKPLYGVTLDKDQCILCGKCAQVCPSSSIRTSKEKGLDADNETCVRCLKCIEQCPKGCIKFGRMKSAETTETDLTKRNFLAGVVLAAGTFAVAKLYKPLSKKYAGEDKNPIVPPGAGSPERFYSRCTSCLLCVSNCSGNVLTCEYKKVYLDFDKGFCEYNCNACSQMCPMGAIEKMGLDDKKLCKIGEANIELYLCVVVANGTECGACSEQCPTGAIQMRESQSARIPYFISKDICIGCGACQNACPVRPKQAVWVEPIPLQLKAKSAEEFFKERNKNTQEIPSENNSDEWGF